MEFFGGYPNDKWSFSYIFCHQQWYLVIQLSWAYNPLEERPFLVKCLLKLPSRTGFYQETPLGEAFFPFKNLNPKTPPRGSLFISKNLNPKTHSRWGLFFFKIWIQKHPLGEAFFFFKNLNPKTPLRGCFFFLQKSESKNTL